MISESYRSNILIKDYGRDIEEEFGMKQILESKEEFINSLNNKQLLACITWFYLWDSLSEGSLIAETIAEGKLLKYISALLEREDVKDLYPKMIEYSKEKSIEALRRIAIEGGLEILIEYCSYLYMESHCDFYAFFDEAGHVFQQKKKQDIPDYYPQSYDLLVENVIGVCYGMMLGCLEGKREYLDYPSFDEMEKHIDELSLEESMQYFLFYNRLPTRYGHERYFKKWKDGTALKIVRQMQNRMYQLFAWNL